MSPAEEAAELAELSPDTDLCSSVSLAGVTNTLDNSDMDRSSGESKPKTPKITFNKRIIEKYLRN